MAPAMAKVLARAAWTALGPCRFITVTSPGDEDHATSYAAFSKRWRRLHERIRRRFRTIEYLLVLEPQKRGAAHLHMVYRGPFIPQRWLSRAAEQSGFGRIADIRLAPSTIAIYITKSLNLELSDPSLAPPPFFRRVRWSRHWSDWVRPTPTRAWSSWFVVYAVPAIAAEIAASLGFTVVEVGGGGRAKLDAGGVVAGLRNLRDHWRGRRSGRPAGDDATLQGMR